MNDEIKEILDGFDKCLKNYELDKAFGQISVESIYHLFPHKQLLLKDYITNLQQEKEDYKSRCEKINDILKEFPDFNYSNDYMILKRKIEEALQGSDDNG